LERDFFMVSAQVIPLLVLIGLIDHRGTPTPGGRHRWGGPVLSLALLRMGVMLGCVLGELAALVAISGHPTLIEQKLVVGGLILGGLMVVDRFVDIEFERLIETMRPAPRMVLILAYLVVLAAALVVPIFVVG
jgi:hypothetical protein